MVDRLLVSEAESVESAPLIHEVVMVLTTRLRTQGGYMRLYKPGQDIKQIPERLKAQVPSEIQEQAREMARKELAKRLAEIDLTTSQGAQYTQYHNAVLPHVQQLVTFLDNLEANEEERVWLKRQGDGELDESRLSEGLTGETTIYKRRGMEKRELTNVMQSAPSRPL